VARPDAPAKRAAGLIDLTRLASRLGQGALTGIDRVELAWAEHLLSLSTPVFGLVRMKLGYALLDRAGTSQLLDRVLARAPLGASDLAGRILWRRVPHRARMEADLRRLCMARASSFGLARLLRRVGPRFDYFNLGHANLTKAGLAAIKRSGGRVVVLLHDTIPLDFPHYTRVGIPEVFARKLAAVSAQADLIIHSTHDARQKSERHLAQMGRVPPGIVANLGVVAAAADSVALPVGLGVDRPFFLALGTIEPRKNLGLLCDVWQSTPDLPPLYIVGNKGWASADLFERISETHGITLLGPLPDGAVAALMDKALALVFPSFAEGFGLPPLEAAARGLPVLCSDLPVLRELLADLPVYLEPTDVYAWRQELLARTKKGAEQIGRDQGSTGSRFALPSWDAHFNAILTALELDSSTDTGGGAEMAK
jgi:glycosyltransferase involved in cell wall biosynthesis